MVAHRHEPPGCNEPHLLELGRLANYSRSRTSRLQDCGGNSKAGFVHGAGAKAVAVPMPCAKEPRVVGQSVKVEGLGLGARS